MIMIFVGCEMFFHRKFKNSFFVLFIHKIEVIFLN
jgi:hypothetical protein